MNKLTKGLVVALFLLIATGVAINESQERAVDRSKIPLKVEESRGFQRWITNLKNKGLNIEADTFKLIEENEIYNTKWITISSIDEEGKVQEYETRIREAQDQDKIVFAPSERAYVDYREMVRLDYKPNEVVYYGIRDNKIIDARIVDCSLNGNCHFDRAWFLQDSNDVIVISEVSRNVDKKDPNVPFCARDEICTYTFKLHVIDLLRNSRLVYESTEFEAAINELIPNL